MGRDSVIANEKLFRALITDAKKRDFMFPQSITFKTPLEEILQFVSEKPILIPRTGVRISFNKGSCEYFKGKISDSQVIFGYSDITFLSGGGALLLYDVLDDRVEYNKQLSRFRS